MSDSTPLWRQAFDTIEHVVAAGLEEVMRTEAFAELLALATMSWIGTRRRVESFLGHVLHLGNLPTNRDVQRLQDLLLHVDRHVRDLAKRVEDLEPDAGTDQPHSL